MIIPNNIYVRPKGRFGNACFQFMVSRIFKIIYNYNIVYSVDLLNNPIIFGDKEFLDWKTCLLNNNVSFHKNRDILFDGYFQYSDMYCCFKDIIIKYIKNCGDDYFYDMTGEKYYCKILLSNTINDYSRYKTIIHLRIEDFISLDLAIDPRNYDSVLKKCEEPYLFIHKKCENIIDNKYINYFKIKYPTSSFFDGDIEEAYSIIKNTRNTIICSFSTLSLSAAFFNDNCKKCFIPINNLEFQKLTNNTELYTINRITSYNLNILLENIIYDKRFNIISSTNLSHHFKKKTDIQYPHFKNGQYLEEFFLNYLEKNNPDLGKYKYIDCLWTNIHNDPNFKNDKDELNKNLQLKLLEYPSDTKFFTIVQCDDGPLLNIPKDTIIFGSCSGTIPLPLIYEDIDNKLLANCCHIDTIGNYIPKIKFNDKNILCSFVGSLTHPIRNKMKTFLENKHGFRIYSKELNQTVTDNEAQFFVITTTNSKFALAPRGYGRSSFRFFEIFLLGSIPIYIYDDIEWLPYMDVLNYKDFCISIHESDIDKLPNLLNNITEEQYNTMWNNFNKISHYFTFETMSKYIINKIRTI